MTLAEEMRKFADILEYGVTRQLTPDEYRFIKNFPLQECVESFWKNHLTSSGYLEYRRAPSAGRYGKWKVYEDIYKKYNNPLIRLI